MCLSIRAACIEMYLTLCAHKMPTRVEDKNRILADTPQKAANPTPVKSELSLSEKQKQLSKFLVRENLAIRAELASQKKRYKKLEKISLVLGAPWLILLAPLTILWAVGRVVSKARKPKRSSNIELIQNGELDREKVSRAFYILQVFGLDLALTELENGPVSAPPGASALFEAHEATNDTVWAEATNHWLAHQSSCRIDVIPGDAPRFGRLRFSEITPVESGPKISVIMPAFNAEQWIELAARSILNQSWRNLELIVVNDRSSDRTGEILEELSKTDTRMRVLHNPVNVGPYVSKNAALSFATGEYITGHDADDIALPDRLHRQVGYLISDSQTAGVIGQMIRVNKTGVLSVTSTINNMSFDGIHRIAMISLMVRRDVVDRFGYWDCVRFGADSEYRARLTAHLGNRLKTVPDLTMICLNDDDNLTNDPKYGTQTVGGMSPVRRAYQDNWLTWHSKKKPAVIHREFSNAYRPFSAPSEMLVPQDDIETLRAYYASLLEQA